MHLTEEEAKGKWCPFVRHANGSGGVGVNRVNWDATYGYANCVGAACMAWRKSDQIGIGPNGETRTRDMDGRTRWVDRGYCGLAGKPTP